MVLAEYQRNTTECVKRLKALLKVFPEENYDLLKHMIRFLAIVTCNESVNKMSPMALAIVFGPNLFRLVSYYDYTQIIYRHGHPQATGRAKNIAVFYHCTVPWSVEWSWIPGIFWKLHDHSC